MFQDAFELQPLVGGQRQGQHVAAFIDGVVPYADPFEGVYDPNNTAIRVTQLAGALTREIVLIYTGAKLSAMVAGPTRWAASTFGQRFLLQHLWPSALVGGLVPGLTGLYSAGSLANLAVKIASLVDTWGEISDLLRPDSE